LQDKGTKVIFSDSMNDGYILDPFLETPLKIKEWTGKEFSPVYYGLKS
jgi:hypothetical protein